MEDHTFTVNASDLRQYVYCHRVIYYRYCIPVRPPPTYKMVEGKLQHEETEALEHRRSLRAYGLTDGERVFNVRLASERLGLSGLLDLVILRRHEVIPVEFKYSEARPADRGGERPRESIITAGSPAAIGESRRTGTRRSSAPEMEVSLHHKYQLAAYALLAEERWERPAWRCFVYFMADRRAAQVAITDGVRRYTRRLLAEIRQMIATQRMPEATRQVGRCWECEYRRFCNDVD